MLKLGTMQPEHLLPQTSGGYMTEKHVVKTVLGYFELCDSARPQAVRAEQDQQVQGNGA
jgi:hypothetical protein